MNALQSLSNMIKHFINFNAWIMTNFIKNLVQMKTFSKF
jgi:hypothetical protein